MTHYFESQLVSTVKAVDESPRGITFKGHYLYGDGASLLFFPPIILAIGLAVISKEAPNETINYSVLIVGIVAALVFSHLIIFRKRIEFHTAEKFIRIHTSKLTGISSEDFQPDQVQLEVLNIHIRLAQNCGAVDLVLPNGKIRLIVDGRYDKAVEKAKHLSVRTGIALKN